MWSTAECSWFLDIKVSCILRYIFFHICWDLEREIDLQHYLHTGSISLLQMQSLLFQVMISDSFHNGLMSTWLKPCENYFCLNFHFNYSIQSQICTCHGSSAVVACAKLWPDLIIIRHSWTRCIFTKFGLWVLNFLVKWVPGGRFKNTYELFNLRALKF